MKKLELGQVPFFPARLNEKLVDLLTKCFTKPKPDPKAFFASIINIFIQQNNSQFIPSINTIDINLLCSFDCIKYFNKKSEIYKMLMESDNSNVGQTLYKCSRIVQKYPYYHKTLSYEFMKLSAEFGYSEGRKYFFLMVLHGYLFNPSKKQAFKLAKKWVDMGDTKSAILLMYCYEKGIGCPQDRSAAFVLLEKTVRISHSFDLQYEYSRYLIDGIATKKNTTEGKTYLSEACRNASKEDIYKYAKFLLKSGLLPAQKIFELLDSLPMKSTKVTNLLIKLQMTHCVGDESQIVPRLISQVQEEFATKEYHGMAEYLLICKNRGKNRKGNMSMNWSIVFSDTVYSALQIPVYKKELIRRESLKDLKSQIFNAQGKTEYDFQTLSCTLTLSNDPFSFAHYEFCKEDRNLLNAETGLQMEITNNNNKAAKAELILFLLSKDLTLQEDAEKQLLEMSDVPEAKNALAYYYYYKKNENMKDVLPLLLKSFEEGCLVAGYNYWFVLDKLYQTDEATIKKSLEFKEKFLKETSLAFYGVFSVL